MRPLLETVARVNAYSASSDVVTDLPRDGFITQLQLLLEAQYDNGASVTPNKDAFYRIFNAVRVKGDSAQYVDIGDPILLHLLNLADSGHGYKAPKVDTTASATDRQAKVPFVLHFGDNPDDPYDPLNSPGRPWVVIPAETESNLSLTINWAANTAMGSGITIDTATAIRVAVARVQGAPPAGAKLYRPVYSLQKYQINATWSNLSLRFDVPTGGYVRRVAIGVYDNASPIARDDTRVTRVALILPKEAQSRRLELTWHELKHYTVHQYPRLYAVSEDAAGTPDVNGSNGHAGFGVIDFRKLSGNPLGLNMVGVPKGDAQIAFDVGTANGEIHLLWDTVEPM